MRFLILIHILLLSILYTNAQDTRALDSVYSQIHNTRIVNEDEEIIRRVMIKDQYVSALITDGDTLVIQEIENINITAPRTFENRDDYLRYLKYRRYAAKVYPYAKEAIRIFREAEYATSHMRKRKRKKHLKSLSKALQKDFTDPLKQLSKTQGKILVEMIERELNTSIFDLIKMTHGKFKAFYWNQSSKLYGYRLKNPYKEGDNPILDVVLRDFDISYRVPLTSAN